MGRLKSRILRYYTTRTNGGYIRLCATPPSSVRTCAAILHRPALSTDLVHRASAIREGKVCEVATPAAHGSTVNVQPSGPQCSRPRSGQLEGLPQRRRRRSVVRGSPRRKPTAPSVLLRPVGGATRGSCALRSSAARAADNQGPTRTTSSQCLGSTGSASCHPSTPVARLLDSAQPWPRA